MLVLALYVSAYCLHSCSTSTAVPGIFARVPSRRLHLAACGLTFGLNSFVPPHARLAAPANAVDQKRRLSHAASDAPSRKSRAPTSVAHRTRRAARRRCGRGDRAAPRELGTSTAGRWARMQSAGVCRAAARPPPLAGAGARRVMARRVRWPHCAAYAARWMAAGMVAGGRPVRTT